MAIQPVAEKRMGVRKTSQFLVEKTISPSVITVNATNIAMKSEPGTVMTGFPVNV
jgi:hypothetical protein